MKKQEKETSQIQFWPGTQPGSDHSDHSDQSLSRRWRRPRNRGKAHGLRRTTARLKPKLKLLTAHGRRTIKICLDLWYRVISYPISRAKTVSDNRAASQTTQTRESDNTSQTTPTRESDNRNARVKQQTRPSRTTETCEYDNKGQRRKWIHTSQMQTTTNKRTRN